jgi:hypothetical protein
MGLGHPAGGRALAGAGHTRYHVGFDVTVDMPDDAIAGPARRRESSTC